MRATVDRDVIVMITAGGGTEIGSIPKGVGMERLRFDGEKVVDLADLASIWVKYTHSGIFELHAVPVPGAQLVAMRYLDRGRLTMDAGVIRLKTSEELDAERVAIEQGILKAQTRGDLATRIGDRDDQLADTNKLVYLILQALLTRDPEVLAFLEGIRADIEATYPMEKLAAELPATVKSIREQMQKYYTEKDTILAKG